MVISQQIKKGIQEYFINRRLTAGKNIPLAGKLNQAEGLAMFFCINTKAELDSIRQLSGKALKDYRKLGIYVFTNSHESLDVITNKAIYFFNLDDFTLFGKMKERMVALIENNKYDLLISFDQTGFPVCRNFVNEIRAGFKVGTATTENCDLYHLTLACKEDNFDFIKYYDQVRHYISVLNIKMA